MIFCQDFEQGSARWFFCFLRHILESLSDIQLAAKLVQDGFTHLSGTLTGTTAGRWGSAQPHPLYVFSGPVHVVSPAGNQSSYIHFSLVPQRTKIEEPVFWKVRLRTDTASFLPHSSGQNSQRPAQTQGRRNRPTSYGRYLKEWVTIFDLSHSSNSSHPILPSFTVLQTHGLS